MKTRLLLFAAHVAVAALLAATAAWGADVVIEPFGFAPPFSTVRDNENVHWTNSTPDAQQVVSDEGLFDSGPIPPGGGFSLHLPVPGDHTYSSPPSGFTGTLSVAPTSIAGDPNDLVADHIPDLPFPDDPATDRALDPDLGIGASKSRIIVRFNDDVTVADANAALQDAAVTIVGGLPRFGILLVESQPADSDLPDDAAFARRDVSLASLRASEAVAAAAKDLDLELKSVPRPSAPFTYTWKNGNGNSTSTSPANWLWGDPGPNGETWNGDNWYLEADRVPQAWNLLQAIKKKRSHVDVASLDEPADTSHDLNHVFLEPLCTSTGRCSDSTVGAADDHGTHVAGTIAGTFDNGVGTDGVDPLVTVHSIGENFVDSPSSITVQSYSSDLQLFYLILRQKLIGNWPDLRVINYSAAFPPPSTAKMRLRHPGAGNDCGPGPNDDGPPNTDPCSMENDDTWLTEFDHVGQVAAPIAQVASDAGVMIVQAAGNESNDFCFPLDAEPPSCQISPHIAGLLQRVSAERSGEFIWASKRWNSLSDNPVFGVEAVGDDSTRPGSPSVMRASFSNPGGDISAPGVRIVSNSNGGGYTAKRGTSMAAPQVTGAIAYLLAYDPTLTIAQVRSALLLWANNDVGGGASPRLDLFASLMSLDGAAKDLVDVNDRSADGDQRTRLDPGGGRTELAALPIQPDHNVDMKDFRAFRDAWLVSCQHAVTPASTCPAPGDIQLDGAADHMKRDLNLDGCVSPPPLVSSPTCPTTEDHFSRFDFNGDGVVDRYKTSDMPFDRNGIAASPPGVPLTDLEVLASQWNASSEHTEGWTPSDLEGLMLSGDLEIHADDLVDAGATDIEVKVTPAGGSALPTRHLIPSLQPQKSFIVETVPTSSGQTHVQIEATATVGGEAIKTSPLQVDLGIGEDKRVDLCKGLTVTATPSELAADGKATAKIVATLHKCSDVEVANKQIAFSLDPSSGDSSLTQTDSVTKADGTATAKFSVGTTPDTYKVKVEVTLDNGARDTAEATIKVRPPIKVTYIWKQHIEDWTESGSSRWGTASPAMPDCTIPGVVDYCIDNFDVQLTSEANGGVVRSGTLEGGVNDFTVTDQVQDSLGHSHADWGLTFTNGRRESGGANYTWEVTDPSVYQQKPLPGVSASFGEDGVHVVGIQNVGDLPYHYNLLGQRTGSGATFPVEAHGVNTAFLLIPQGGGQIRFAALTNQIVFPLDAASQSYLPFQSCGLLEQDLTSQPGYLDRHGTQYIPAGAILNRKQTYSAGDRPMPVGPGHLKVTYSFGAVVTVGDGPAQTPTLPDCSVNHPPDPKFDAPAQTLEGRQTHFDDRSTDVDNDITSWHWDFGDGEPAQTDQNPFHIFPDNGTYTVTLTVTDEKGATASTSKQIVVNNQAPLAYIDDATAEEGQPLHFNFGIWDAGKVDKQNLTWTITSPTAPWPTLQNTEAAGELGYTALGLPVGVYPVTLTVTDKDNDSTTAEATLEVTEGPPPVCDPVTGANCPPPPPVLPPVVACGTSAQLDPEEQSFLNLVNAYRIQNGVPPLLGVSPTLQQAATDHAHDMAVHDYMAHIGLDGRDPFQRAHDAGYPHTAGVGENLATDTETGFQALWAWKSSTTGHNENMLNPLWRAIGIAREKGNHWRWATSYGTVLDCPPAAPSPAPAAKLSAFARALPGAQGSDDLTDTKSGVRVLHRVLSVTTEQKDERRAQSRLGARADASETFGPGAAFTISDVRPLRFDPVTLTNRARDASGNPIEATLDFGDGTPTVSLAADESTVHSFTQPEQSVVVTLTATDADGLTTSVERSIFVRGLPHPSLAYTGPSQQDVTDKTLAVAAVLRDPSTGSPLGGETLTFTLEGSTATAKTDASGTAQTTIDLTGLAAGTHTITVSFAGNADYAPVDDLDSVTLFRTRPNFTYTGSTQGVTGKTLAVAAKLLHPTTGAPIAGGVVTFSLAGSSGTTATTDGSGIANATLDLAGLAAGSYTLTASFPGNTEYVATTVSSRIDVVTNVPPVANAGGPYILGTGGTLLLDGSRSSDADQGDSIADWAWDLNGDGATDVTGRTPRALQWQELQTILCTVACVANHDYPVTVTVTDTRGERSSASSFVRFASDFALFLGNETKTVVPGQSNSFAVTVVGSSDFHSPVTLSAIGLPAGVTATFSVNPVTPPGVSVLTLTASASAPSGTFPVHVRGTSNGITHDVSDDVVVAFGLIPICYGAAEGTVVDTSGAPIAGVRVTDTRSLIFDTTDTNGRFTLRNLPLGINNAPSTVAANATKGGWWDVSATAATACGATTHLALTMLAKRTAHVSGAIHEGTIGATGQVVPTTNVVPGSLVVLEAPAFNDTPVNAPADATGVYAADVDLSQNNTPRSYNATASAPGYWFQTKGVLAESGVPKQVDFLIVKQCKATFVGGTVHYQDGTAVPNHRVGFDADGSGFTVATTTTDADGNFTLNRDELLGYNNSPRNYFLHVFATGADPPGTSTAVIPWPVSACGERSTRSFTFNRPVARRGAFEGTVLDEETHAPVAGAVVGGYTDPNLPGNSGPSLATTDADGHFHVDNVLIGYDVQTALRTITVAKTGYYSLSVNTTLAADTTNRLDLNVLQQRFGIAQGHVRDAVTHAPIAAASLRVPGLPCSFFFCASTDRDGNYSSNVTLGFRNAPASATVTFSADGYWDQTRLIAVTADKATTTDVDLLRKCTPAKIVGTVVNAVTQQPISGADVHGGGRVASTDASGHFELTDVQPGFNNNPLQVLLTASATGFISQSKPVTVFCGATITVDFGTRQSALGIVAGTLTDGDTGQPIPNAFVGGEFGGTTTTDANGNYRFTGVPLGDQDTDRQWSITAAPVGYPPKSQLVTAKANVEVRADFSFSKSTNHPPVATPKSFTLDENGNAALSFAGTDADGDALTFTVATYPSHGQLGGAPPNTTYFPDRDYSGPDSFTYTAFDGQDISAPATVTIDVKHVNRVPVARFDQFTTTTDTPATLDVLANDTDADGGTLTITGLTPDVPMHGTLSIVANKVLFSPEAGFQGDVCFFYAISDGQGGTASTLACIDVAPGVSTPTPACAAASFSAAEDGVLQDTLACTGGSAPLTYAITQDPTHGTLTVDPSGSFAYTPAADYFGPDSFAFTASDGSQTSAPATASITVTAVNDSPSAVDDTAAVVEDGSVLLDVRANDSSGPANESSQSVTVTAAGAGAHGSTLVLTAGADAGKVLYAPAPGFNGSDSFSYTVCDDGSPTLCATATARVTISPVNDAPTAHDTSVSLPEDAPPRAIDLGALVADDETAIADLHYEIVAAPAKGVLTGTGPVFSYDSNQDANGADSFTYRVVDRGDPDGCAVVAPTCSPPLASAMHTVSISLTPVNDPPVAQLTTAGPVPEGSPAALHAAATDVDGDPLTYAWSAGEGTISGEGADVSLRTADGPASVPVSVVVSDGQAPTTADAVVHVENVAPTVTAGAALTANEGVHVALTAASFSDPGARDTHTATVNWGDGSAVEPATIDATSLSASHTYAAHGTYTVTLTVTDNDGGVGTATTAASIAPPSHAPIANDASVTTTFGTPVAVTLHASDPDGDALNYNVRSLPTHGTLTGTAPTLTYTPSAGYSGPDSFTFTANDGKLDSNTAMVSINVSAVNRAPIALDQSVSTAADAPVAITLRASDPDGDAVGYTITSQPTHGSLSGTAPALTYTPTSGYSGPDSFTFTANDGKLDSNTATISLTITPTPPLNHAPTAADTSVTTLAGVPLAVTLNASDPDGDPLAYTLLTQPAHGMLTGVAPALTFTPAAGYNGPDSFTFKVSDGRLESNTATVSITVTGPSAGGPVLGSDKVGPSVDASNDPGKAEAFRVASPADGTISSLAIYLAPNSAATSVILGLYLDDGGHPGRLLSRGTISPVSNGAWNRVAVPTANVNAGSLYWLAILGEGGVIRFYDFCCGAGGTAPSESSASLTLADLPPNWATGVLYHDSPASAYAPITPGPVPPPPPPPGPPPLGVTQVGPQLDNDTAGQAETFAATATGSGPITVLRLYLDPRSNASRVIVGLYDDAGGHPNNLLSTTTITTPTSGWNEVALNGVTLNTGSRYWIALLSPIDAGTVFFRDRAGNPTGNSETSKQTTLDALPTHWTTGKSYEDAPLSAYGPRS